MEGFLESQIGFVVFVGGGVGDKFDFADINCRF